MEEPHHRQTCGDPVPALELVWSPGLQQDVLDPAVWQEGLDTYARATHLAVALVDVDGRLLGACLNPQPTWQLLRAQRPPDPPGCPFCLLPRQPGRCVADALAAREVRITHDRTGLAHLTVPLVLGDHVVGALLAGQVFDQYPDQLALEQIAVTAGLRPAQVGQRARLELPVSRATLRVYGDLLATLGRTFLQTRYDQAVDAHRLAEMTRLRDLLQQHTQDLTVADRQKDAFLATLAHELRNPLAPLRTAVALVQDHRPLDPEVEWGVGVIDRQLRHMTRLVDDLLDLSRITRDTLELRPERLDLAAVLQVAVETSRALLEANDQELVVTLPPEPIMLDADPVRLAQVVANLLTNAAKYTEPHGHIGLTAESHEGEAVITVRDTGIGISAEWLPHIFELFTQGEPTSARVQSGLGVGLSLVQRLVALHGGTVTAHSAGPGQGSVFTVRLPLASAPVVARPEAGLAPTPPASMTARRILVVDDERLSAIGLQKLLVRQGHAIRTAHDGLEALEVADAFRPEVMLLDIGLPRLDGYEVAQHIRQQPWGQGMVLIALTGWGQASDRQRSQAAGFDHHLVKPVDSAVLRQLLAALPAPGAAGDAPQP
jgi:signal transduction histidine kinase/ActR/RegA family two-component response regulator